MRGHLIRLLHRETMQNPPSPQGEGFKVVGTVSGIYIFFSGFYIQFEIGFLYNVGIIFKEDFYGLSQASQQFPFSYVYYYL